MGTSIVKTKNQAIEFAKEALRSQLCVKRIYKPMISNTSVRCACGETNAVSVYSNYDQMNDVVVGYCSGCGFSTNSHPSVFIKNSCK